MTELINGRNPAEIKAAVINCDEHCSCLDCPEDERGYCDQNVVIKYARCLIQRLEAERDAIYESVKRMAMCKDCKSVDAPIMEEPCKSCKADQYCDKNNWAWKGVRVE